MNKTFVSKALSVVVILLFIGVSIAPSINANISKEMVEFTTEVCGLNGGKHTVKLTKGQADEVETLFDSIKDKLDKIETREETEEIFKETVVELDKYGLLGGLSVEQAQKLVTQDDRYEKIENIFKKYPNIYDSTIGFQFENLFCFTFIVSEGMLLWCGITELIILLLLYVVGTDIAVRFEAGEARAYEIMIWILSVFTCGVIALIAQLIPIALWNIILPVDLFSENPGFLTSVGLMGRHSGFFDLVIGFKGIRLLTPIPWARHFYIGHSLAIL